MNPDDYGVPAHLVTQYPGIGPVIEGWKSIAEALGGRSRWTVQGYAKDPVNPLPVERWEGELGRVFIRVKRLGEWVRSRVG